MIYITLYYLTLITHYVITPGFIFWYSGLSWGKAMLISLVIWVISGVIFQGCIFTYAEQYLANKAWGTEISYGFEQSSVYKLVIKYVGKD